ncbi:MAG: hypothetical protein IJ200_02530, partial [Prevotella sp.]|nr:hypothetical protein [Prevotella sp.]
MYNITKITRLMKQTKKLWMLAALPMLLGLASCTDNDDNPAVNDGTETVEAPDETLPTTDQMTTRITTPRGHVICRMNSSQRAAETNIISLCYE